jgi:solute carrier family 25 oxoglutarate transporter 11
MASGALASVVGNPFDISLVRMQADGLKPAAERRGYKNVFDALLRISREEGVPRLWRGFEPTVFRAIAMNVGMMATYDQVRGAIVAVNGEGAATNLMASAVSGLACVCTSLPFDLIKTRLQNMRPDAAGVMPYKGVLDCGRKIMLAEGPLAFWTGFLAYYGRTAPHAMIILLTMEQLNKVYTRTFHTA